MGCLSCKYPIFITLFTMYILAAFLAIATGGFLIEASLYPTSIMEASASNFLENNGEIYR